MQPFVDNRYLYQTVNSWHQAMQLPSSMFRILADQFDERMSLFPINDETSDTLLPKLQRGIAIQFRLLQRLTQSYQKPAFGIKKTKVGTHEVRIEEHTVFETPFCKLLHFKKERFGNLPKLLLIAPMAGHHATLLRDTVRDSLPYFDVYITDWMNARDVPISCGGFDMDSYIGTLLRCFEHMKSDFNVVAICQSGVPAYAAVSLIEENKNMRDLLPNTLTIMGSPIDVRRSPTSVNEYANEHQEDWFEQMALSIVPEGFPGARRLVYPGFMQLMAFVSMNPQHHQKSIGNAISHYVDGDFEAEAKISSFYSEYLSVMDLTSEFYLQTLRVVFQEALLPQGKMVFRGSVVNPGAIRNTAIFAVEGERDDICGLGQTKAALDLAKHLPASKKHYLMLKEAGHYGLFNGHRFRQTVLPELIQFVEQHKAADKTTALAAS